MEEIEIKILDINRKKIVAKLTSWGAKKIFAGKVESSFFDFPDQSIRRDKKTIRLRKMGDKTFLTFKNPIPHNSVKIREEHEIEVSDFTKARQLLENLGLAEWRNLKKYRISYLLADTRFEFDKYHGQYEYIPEFLEIEAPNVETIYKYVERLGFKKENCKPWTLSDIIKNLYSQ